MSKKTIDLVGTYLGESKLRKRKPIASGSGKGKHKIIDIEQIFDSLLDIGEEYYIQIKIDNPKPESIFCPSSSKIKYDTRERAREKMHSIKKNIVNGEWEPKHDDIDQREFLIYICDVCSKYHVGTSRVDDL